MKFEVLILGNSSATPMYERHPTSQLLNVNEQYYLIDCGEGTQMQLARFGVKATRINHIFISHLHGDHYLGLMGLLSSQNLMGRKTDLHLYGPAPLLEILTLQFKYSDTTLRYQLLFHATDAAHEELLLRNNSIEVHSFPLRHRVPCTGFRFEEVPQPASLNVEAVSKLNIPKAFYSLLKKGFDYESPAGQIYAAKDLTTPAPATRSYAFCSDTIRFPDYLASIKAVDLLYHESTFLHDMVDRARETFHTTSREAAEIAIEVQAKRLLLGHFSARYKDLTPLLEEAQSIFPETVLSEEGKWFLI